MSGFLLLVEIHFDPFQTKSSSQVLSGNDVEIKAHSRILFYFRVFNSNYDHESKHLEMKFSHI